MKGLKDLLSIWQGLSLWKKLLSLVCLIPLALFLFFSLKGEELVRLSSSQSATKLQSQLKPYGIQGKLRNHSLWVPTKQKKLANWLVKKQKKSTLPSWIVQDSFFETPWKSRLKVHFSLEKRLEEMLCSIPGVKRAMVRLTMPQQKIFGQGTFGKKASPKAAITIFPVKNRRGLHRQEVSAIAHIVSSSVESLEPAQVAILCQGRYYSLENVQDRDPREMMEENCRYKLQKALASLPIQSFSLSISSEKQDSVEMTARLVLVMAPVNQKKKRFYQAFFSNLLFPVKLQNLQFFEVVPPVQQKKILLSKPLKYTFLALAILISLWVLFSFFPWHLIGWDGDLENPHTKKTASFEDLHLLSDRVLRDGLTEVNKGDLALALKVSPPQIRKKITKNLSHKDRKYLKKEMECLGPVRLSSVESAQLEIWQALQRGWKK